MGFLVALLSSGALFAAPIQDPKFFANEAFLKQFPGATVLHRDSLPFLQQSKRDTLYDARKLVTAIQRDLLLTQSVRKFDKLTPSDRKKVLRRVFDLEVRASGRKGPVLVLDDKAKRATFFEFDPKKPDSGKVILNPTQLFADPNPYAALLFLIHETRHAYQFQTAFLPTRISSPTQSDAYRLGFEAQKEVFDKRLPVSFCDFLTLNQEHEAFLFGNIVMELLTHGDVDTTGMGTLASQYVPNKGLRLDLLHLAKSTRADALLDVFNHFEEAQYKELGKP